MSGKVAVVKILLRISSSLGKEVTGESGLRLD